MTLKRSHYRALARLHDAHQHDDGWARCTNAGPAPRIEPVTAAKLVRAGFACYLPRDTDWEPQYVRITLAGVAALRQQTEGAAA